MKYRAAFFCNDPKTIDRVYGADRVRRIGEMCELYPAVIGTKNAAENMDIIENAEVIFSTWGMPAFSDETICGMKNLKCILYGAGSVKYFAEPYLKRGITVISAAFANGELVAKYTLAQITLAAKGYFRRFKAGGFSAADRLPAVNAKGLFDIDVGVVGAGNIGRLVLSGLAGNCCRLWLYDPYVSEERAAELGAKKTTLEEMFARCDIVTNHAPNIPQTVGMLTGSLFESMPEGAVFINTGRGATVNEPEMVSVLSRRADITAFLDVTDPEPPAADSQLLKLPNIFYTPHIAGTLGREVRHMADYCITEYGKWLRGEKSDGEVTLERFALLA